MMEENWITFHFHFWVRPVSRDDCPETKLVFGPELLEHFFLHFDWSAQI